MPDLSNVGARSKLKPKPGNAPYFHRVHGGCFVGFRPSVKDEHGSWLARVYDEFENKYRQKPLGKFADVEGGKQFKAAKTEAEKFLQLIESGGGIDPKVVTVGDACREYLGAIDVPAKRADAENRFRRFVFGQPIERVKLERLRRAHLEQWRGWLQERPALVSRSKRGERITRRRADSTLNRDMVPLRAALTKFLAKGNPGTPAAWQEALTPIEKADGRRELYLTKSQRRALLEHTGAEAVAFVTALCLLPLRPGAMAALTVANFNRRNSQLTIAFDKAGKGRTIAVPPAAEKLLSDQCREKLPAAPVFTRRDGSGWTRHSWKGPIALAAKAAGLPIETTAYTLRHSTISDLVNDGLPIHTVAVVSGTSVDMIERHYGKVTDDASIAALSALAL